MLPLEDYQKAFDETLAVREEFETLDVLLNSICAGHAEAAIGILTARAGSEVKAKVADSLRGLLLNAQAGVRERIAAARFLSTIPGSSPELVSIVSSAIVVNDNQARVPLALTLAAISLSQAVIEADPPSLSLLAPALLSWLELLSSRASQGGKQSVRDRSLAFAVRVQLGCLLNNPVGEKFGPLISEALQQSAVGEEPEEAKEDDKKRARPSESTDSYWRGDGAGAVAAVTAALPPIYVVECLLMTSLVTDLDRMRRSIGLLYATNTSSVIAAKTTGAIADVAMEEEPPRKRPAVSDPRRRRDQATPLVPIDSPLIATLKRILRSPVLSRRRWYGLVGALMAGIPEAATDVISYALSTGSVDIAREFMRAAWVHGHLSDSSNNMLYDAYLVRFLEGFRGDSLVAFVSDLPAAPFSTLQPRVPLAELERIASARPALRAPLLSHLIRSLDSDGKDVVIEIVIRMYAAYPSLRQAIERAAMELPPQQWPLLVRLVGVEGGALLPHLCLLWERLHNEDIQKDVVEKDAMEDSTPSVKDAIKSALPMALSQGATEKSVAAFAAALLQLVLHAHAPASVMEALLVPSASALLAKPAFASILAEGIRECLLGEPGFDIHLLLPVIPFLKPQDLLPDLSSQQPQQQQSTLLPRIFGVAAEGEGEEAWLRAVLARLTAECGLVDAADLFVRLHGMESLLGIKKTIAAMQACYSLPAIFKAEVLAAAMQTLLDRFFEDGTLPVLFMRTLIQSYTLHKTLSGFVTGILPRMLAAPNSRGNLWEGSPRNWEGFIRACRLLLPGSLPALAALPRDRLEEALDSNAGAMSGASDMRAAVKEYLYGQPPSVRRRYAAIMDVLQSST